ncbi:MAG: hypothetical protein AD742_00770 [Methylibium sp. NZG]|nr:MAG: hypothetical protein AD742_00770 [Methylibium sp. NZG]
MNSRTPFFGAALVALAAVSAGCSTRQVYDGLRAGSRNACQRYAEPDRSRCLAANDTDYEKYRRERDEMMLK